MSTASGEAVPESTLQGIAMTFGYNNVIRRFLCYFCSAVQYVVYFDCMVDSAVPDSGMVVEPFVGR